MSKLWAVEGVRGRCQKWGLAVFFMLMYCTCFNKTDFMDDRRVCLFPWGSCVWVEHGWGPLIGNLWLGGNLTRMEHLVFGEALHKYSYQFFGIEYEYWILFFSGALWYQKVSIRICHSGGDFFLWSSNKVLRNTSHWPAVPWKRVKLAPNQEARGHTVP